jgi:ABC-type polar amino acid transport system ATPase subunit
MADHDVPIEVIDTTIAYDRQIILESISFVCRRAEWVLICGENGSGKTALLRALNGLLVPQNGCINILGTRIPGRSKRQAQTAWKLTGTVLQGIALFDTISVLDNVLLAFDKHNRSNAHSRSQALEWLHRLDLHKKIEMYPQLLSGGERQRVALARAFARRPQLLILDEPTAAQDTKMHLLVLQLIRELANDGTAVVMSTHHLLEARQFCNRVVTIQERQLFEE